MIFSLDPLTIRSLKNEAKAMRADNAALTQSQALEAVARAHGFRDWNTASASLPDRPLVPAQVGERVRGTYLSRPFEGQALSVEMLGDGRHFKITVKFDRPVNVSKFDSMVIERQRVTATLDVHGVSLSHTSDGEPHMRLKRA